MGMRAQQMPQPASQAPFWLMMVIMLMDLSLDEARQLFEVRFWGAIAAVKYAAPRIRPGGSIVLTSGTLGVRPAAGAALAASGAAATGWPWSGSRRPVSGGQAWRRLGSSHRPPSHHRQACQGVS